MFAVKYVYKIYDKNTKVLKHSPIYDLGTHTPLPPPKKNKLFILVSVALKPLDPLKDIPPNNLKQDRNMLKMNITG